VQIHLAVAMSGFGFGGNERFDEGAVQRGCVGWADRNLLEGFGNIFDN
jgi:hypothetical protein